MADEKKQLKALTDEELNEAAGGFVITPKQLGFIECANPDCKAKFKPKNGETLCETCRKKPQSFIF